jgi:acyl-CoA dehydrogenase
LDDDIVEAIFDFQTCDLCTYAVALWGKPSSTQVQQVGAVSAIRKPAPDAERFNRVGDGVRAYDGAYELRPLTPTLVPVARAGRPEASLTATRLLLRDW